MDIFTQTIFIYFFCDYIYEEKNKTSDSWHSKHIIKEILFAPYNVFDTEKLNDSKIE